MAVDASGFVPGKALGAQTYVEGVLRGLCARADAEVHVLCGAAAGARLAEVAPDARLAVDPAVPGDPLRRVLWSRRAVPALAARVEADVAFFPLNLAVHGAAPSVVMVHDLVNRFYRRNFPLHSPLVNRAKEWLVARSIRGAARVVTPSRAVADEVVAAYPGAAGRTFAIHEGSEPAAAADGTPSPVARRHPGERLVLVPSFVGPHKNTACLVEGLARLARARPDVAREMRVVFTGGRTPAFAAMERAAAAGGVDGLLTQTGFLSRAALLALYRDVDLVVYPSLYEGFGLPVVEAREAGAPLLLSDIPVHREVSGGHARFFDPRSPAALADALAALLDGGERHRAPDPAPARRWEAYADDLMVHLRGAAA